jgi:dTDP-4-amino-4,6-dideoxygalactose transaminase
MSGKPIPFNRPYLADSGLAHIRAAFTAQHVSGDGDFTRRCQAFLESTLGGGKALLTTSGTDALELSALLLDLRPGDEIVLPAFTFASTANAFALRGARPVFADIRPDTFNLDESQLASAVTPRTRAIVVVHYAGVACEMDAIAALTEQRGLALVEDAAHALFGSFRGKPLGSFGSMAAFSFHETKNLSCGEGGALAIHDPRLVQRAEILREKGTDRSRFFRGEIAKYTWVDVGSSFLPSDILAALLWSQMEIADKIQAARSESFERYRRGLAAWAAKAGVRLPAWPDHCMPSYHLYAMLMPSELAQQGLISHLKHQGIGAVFHYQPLHLTPQGLRFGGRPGTCPVAESVAQRIVRLPLFYGLTAAEQDRIIEAVGAFSP